MRHFYDRFIYIMKHLITVLFYLIFANVFAQKEHNIWYFGLGAGVDFNGPTPTLSLIHI